MPIPFHRPEGREVSIPRGVALTGITAAPTVPFTNGRAASLDTPLTKRGEGCKVSHTASLVHAVLSGAPPTPLGVTRDTACDVVSLPVRASLWCAWDVRQRSARSLETPGRIARD